MSCLYKVNEIFYSLQGEGYHTGHAAVFIRFSGCNLSCSFCDTDFSVYHELSASEITAQAKSLCPNDPVPPMIVLTGGEPTLQVDAELIEALHVAGFPLVAMESNGTHRPPENLDWLCVSPKCKTEVKHCDELKLIFDGSGRINTYGITADHYYLQPCDTGDGQRNAAIVEECVEYIKRHPAWQLSLQTHKLVGFK